MSFGTAIVDHLLGETDEIDPAQFVDDFMHKQGYALHPKGVDDENILRFVKVIRKYHLVLWDTHRQNDSRSHNHLGYRFVGPGGKVLFQGTDLGVPASTAIDSDEVVDQLLRNVVLRPGDTDEDYFANYTSEQMEFADSEDAAQIEYMLDGGERPYEDLDGWE